MLRSERSLSDDQIRAVAPSIFAQAPHGSRSERYGYIPTATVLQELRGESFPPTLTIRPGFPMRVMVNKDLVLRPYRPLFAITQVGP